jgi:hypothetical protein
MADITFEQVKVIPVVAIPYEPKSEKDAERMAAGVVSELMQKGAFQSPATTGRDGDGYNFLAYVRNDGATAVAHILKMAGLDTVVKAWEMDIPNVDLATGQPVTEGGGPGVASKADGTTVALDGAGVLSYTATHTVNEGKRWMIIWAAYLAGVAKPIPVGVVSSGGPTRSPEPCIMPGDKYYRPGEPVTRGQSIAINFRLARLLVGGVNRLHTFLVQYATGRITADELAAQPLFTLNIPAAQKFRDIAPGTAFYEAAQWGAEAGIIGGYDCDPNAPRP